MSSSQTQILKATFLAVWLIRQKCFFRSSAEIPKLCSQMFLSAPTRNTKQIACRTSAALCGVLQLSVYTASFSHSFPCSTFPVYSPIPPREKACRSGNTFTQDAIRDTAALWVTFVPFLIEGRQKTPLCLQKRQKVRALHTRQISCLPKSNTKEGCVVSYVKCHTHTCMPAHTYNQGHADTDTCAESATRTHTYISHLVCSQHLPGAHTHTRINIISRIGHLVAVAMQRGVNVSCLWMLLLQSHPSTTLIIL